MIEPRKIGAPPRYDFKLENGVCKVYKMGENKPFAAVYTNKGNRRPRWQREQAVATYLIKRAARPNPNQFSFSF